MLSQINVDAGIDCAIKEMAETVVAVAGFKGEEAFDATKPNGAPLKLLNVSRLEELG